MIQWDKQYETGIKTIDDQHKVLVRMISQLSDLLVNAVDGEDVYDGMVEIIGNLTSYTNDHFKYEEELFNRLNYELKDAHIEEHSKLIAEIEKLDLRAVDEDQVTYGKMILKFLISWLFKHISGSDFLYRDLFIKNGVQ